jgi:hypothetical protein
MASLVEQPLHQIRENAKGFTWENLFHYLKNIGRVLGFARQETIEKSKLELESAAVNASMTYRHIVGGNVVHLSENTVDNGYCYLFSQ